MEAFSDDPIKPAPSWHPALSRHPPFLSSLSKHLKSVFMQFFLCLFLLLEHHQPVSFVTFVFFRFPMPGISGNVQHRTFPEPYACEDLATVAGFLLGHSSSLITSLHHEKHDTSQHLAHTAPFTTSHVSICVPSPYFPRFSWVADPGLGFGSSSALMNALLASLLACTTEQCGWAFLILFSYTVHFPDLFGRHSFSESTLWTMEMAVTFKPEFGLKVS